MGNEKQLENTHTCIENIKFNITASESQSKNIHEELKPSEGSIAAIGQFVDQQDIEVVLADSDSKRNNSPLTQLQEKFQCTKLNSSDITFNSNDLKNILEETGENRRIKVSAKHCCSYPGCKEIFSRPWRLAAHESLHTGKKPYACSVESCGKKYSSSSHLKRHVDNVHCRQTQIITEYSCPANGCNKIYRSTQSVKKHFKLLHCEKPDDACPRKYQTCNDAIQTGQSMEVPQCVEEHKVEKCQGALSDSTVFNTRRGQQRKIYSCEESPCNKIFPNLLLLRKHLKSEHTSCAEIMCYICDKKFASKSNLKCHIKTHLASYQRKQFECPYEDCSRHYTTKFNLQHHIASKHVGKKFSCMYEECINKTFSTKQKLQKHLNRHLLPPSSKAKNEETTRKKRKDAGLPKRSMAVKLSGVQVPYHIEKSILKHERMEKEESEMSDAIDDEWDASMSGIFEATLHHFDLSKCTSEKQ